jgi:hypothetical protein
MDLWDDQREHISKILNEHNDSKAKELQLLRNQLEIVQKELDSSRKLNEAHLNNVIQSIDNQMNLFKERELFTVSQLLQLEEKFATFKEEKERLISLLRDEVLEIKGHNLLLSKLRGEKL